MAFTYDPALVDPATGTSPSNIRFLLQDVEAAAPEFTDEDIAGVLATRPAAEDAAVKTYRAASTLALAKSRWYGRIGTISSGGKTVDVKAIKAHWEQVAAECAQAAEWIERGDALDVIQGGRTSYQPANGTAMGGDGWLV